MTAQVRKFDSGATRSLVEGRIDPEGFISPLVTRRYCEYMNRNRVLPDGSIRASDNWQLGMAPVEYAKSLARHVEDFKLAHRGYESDQGIEDNLCAIIFNASGYLFEILKAKQGTTAAESDEGEEFTVTWLGGTVDIPREVAYGGITAHVPPYVEADSDDEMSLTAGGAMEKAP